MRARVQRLLPMTAPSVTARAEDRGVPPGLLAEEIDLVKPPELNWWDWTVFLLHSAAEVEHALLVQYLYAAYSLAEGDFAGPHVPPDAEHQVRRWRRTIVGIAQEEMGHLLTVQNLLRFIGGPLNFDREDFPFLSALYPFHFRLEPLSKDSLAKYVSAEMPEHPSQPPEQILEVTQRATQAVGGAAVNRVGKLYGELAALFRDPARLPDDVLRPETADALQASEEDWLGSDIMVVRAVRSRDEAVTAITEIGRQGEGPWIPAGTAPPSHFDRFWPIYQQFPETPPEGPATWRPTRLVPSEPNTLPTPAREPALEVGRITHPLSRLWAQLFNVRYRMLLLDLTHALWLSGPLASGLSRTPRGHLRDWAFLEMKGRRYGGLKGLAGCLVRLPLKDGGHAEEAAAAPTFELPYTLAASDQERDRWHTHLALIEAAAGLVDAITSLAGDDDILRELLAIDGDRRPVIQQQL